VTALEIAGAVAWLVAVGAIVHAARTAGRRRDPYGRTPAQVVGYRPGHLEQLRELEGSGLHRAPDGGDH
jgi:hypothetical protein